MIVRHNPETGLDTVDQAWFDSDASTNAEAIREIDAEAAKYGLTRTREYWLQTFSFEDKVVHRGFCYRPELSEKVKRVEERRGIETIGLPSDKLVRSIRDEE
jgi:hypothetical protein